jgi:hypothetical protein
MPSLQRHYLPRGAIRKTPIAGCAAPGPARSQTRRLRRLPVSRAPRLRMMNSAKISAVSVSD